MFKLIFGLLFFIVIGAIVLKAITPRKRKTPITHSRRPMVNPSFRPTPSKPTASATPKPTAATKPTPAAKPSIRSEKVSSASSRVTDDSVLLMATNPIIHTGYVPMSEPKSKPTINLGCAPDYNDDDNRYNHTSHSHHDTSHTSRSNHSSYDSCSSSDSSSSSSDSSSSSSDSSSSSSSFD